MKKSRSKQSVYFTISAFVISALIFGFALSFVKVHIDAERNPVIYNWGNILSKDDLFAGKKKINIPDWIDLSSGAIRRQYLFPAITPQRRIPVSFKRHLHMSEKTSNYQNDHEELLYLWQRQSFFVSGKAEPVTYRVLISPKGKVLLSYPRKLSLDSRKSISAQRYINNAAFFFNDKLFWTNLKEVVK
ncbi:MAG: hypothetical protein ABH872_06950 [Candidatus Omnitrophota bacterium]